MQNNTVDTLLVIYHSMLEKDKLQETVRTLLVINHSGLRKTSEYFLEMASLKLTTDEKFATNHLFTANFPGSVSEHYDAVKFQVFFFPNKTNVTYILDTRRIQIIIVNSLWEWTEGVDWSPLPTGSMSVESSI